MEGCGEEGQWPGRLWPPSFWSKLRGNCCCKLACEGRLGNDGDQPEGVTMPMLGISMSSLGNPGQTLGGSPMPGVQHMVQLMDGRRTPC